MEKKNTHIILQPNANCFYLLYDRIFSKVELIWELALIQEFTGFPAKIWIRRTESSQIDFIKTNFPNWLANIEIIFYISQSKGFCSKNQF